MNPLLFQQTTILSIALFFAVVNNFIAYKIGFFKLPDNPSAISTKLSYKTIAGAFSVFLVTQLAVIPVLFSLFMYLIFGTSPDQLDLDQDPQSAGWFNLVAMIISSLALLGYALLLKSDSKLLIWDRGESKNISKKIISFLIGAGCWLICYPLVLAIAQGLNLFTYFVFGIQGIDQVAVQSLKAIYDYPALYYGTIATMITFVPILEELLFRGFLQTWARGLFGVKIAIVFTSMIFAFFHFSLIQGASNAAYLAALFILSCFLGLLYEKERTLLAPIGLHSLFNLMSLLLINLT